MFSKTIICLACSRKDNGKCVAGKDYTSHVWIRPVTLTGALEENNIKYSNGFLPKPLDIIKISFIEKCPTKYQSENMQICANSWEKIEEYPKKDLEELVDNPATIFFNDDDSSSQGIFDRIPEEYFETNKFKNSLVLIKPDSIKIVRSNKYWRKVRAEFYYKKVKYNFGVTDPIIEEKYLKYDEGEYEIDNGIIYMCISLASPFYGYCYKLVVTIMEVAKKNLQEKNIGSNENEEMSKLSNEKRIIQESKKRKQWRLKNRKSEPRYLHKFSDWRSD